MRQILKLLPFVLFLALNSCKSKSSKDLIIGTWIPQKNPFGTNEQLVFTETKFLAQSIINGKPNTEKEFNYRISDDNRFLIFDEADKENKTEIVELTHSDLKLKSLNKSDTFCLKRK